MARASFSMPRLVLHIVLAPLLGLGVLISPAHGMGVPGSVFWGLVTDDISFNVLQDALGELFRAWDDGGEDGNEGMLMRTFRFGGSHATRLFSDVVSSRVLQDVLGGMVSVCDPGQVGKEGRLTCKQVYAKDALRTVEEVFDYLDADVYVSRVRRAVATLNMGILSTEDSPPDSPAS